MTIRPLSALAALVVASGTLAGAILPAVASAQPALPTPDYDILVATGSAATHFDAPGRYDLGGAWITVTAFPQAALVGQAVGNPLVGAGFHGDIHYSFVVDGPERDLIVPLFATFALHASAVGSFANASAELSVDFTANDFAEIVRADAAHPTPADLFGTRAFGLEPGRVAQVFLGIDGGSFGGLAEAFADPFIFIDPGFLADHPGYNVRVSEGIGNGPTVSAVPEPETWSLMLGGMAALVSVARRRRSRGR